METSSEVRTPELRQCPRCGATAAVPERYVDWCPECDWNVDPGAPEPNRGRVATVRRRLAGRYGEQLADEIARSGAESGSGAGPGRRDASSVLAIGVSLLVHAVTVGLVVAAGLLIIGGWHTGIQPVLGALLLAAVPVLLPKPQRLPKHAPVLYRADAPRLFELIDEVAATVGTSGVHAVVVDPRATAAVTSYGLRPRRVLFLGLGLWEILSPQERVALLGHELGHFANGDIRSSFVTHWALGALSRWHYFLLPDPPRNLVDWSVNIMLFLPRRAVHGLLLLLDGLTLRASQRAEYLADTGAARAGSTEAAVLLMDRLLICYAVGAELRRESVVARVRGGSTGREAGEAAERGLWERLAARMGSVPESEYERLRRVSARRGHSVDDTHPPTHLRRRCLLSGEPHQAGVVFDSARTAAVAAELAPAREELARRVIRDYAG